MDHNFFITPCIGICKIDNNTGVCVGCKRTKEQIKKWIKFNHEERMHIMKSLGYARRKKRNKFKS